MSVEVMTVDVVSRIFRRVLDSPDVDGESDFFSLGGDSLLATRVLSAVYREFGVELTFDEFALASTPLLLASLVEDAVEGDEGVPR